jgi:hypothetical protein
MRPGVNTRSRKCMARYIKFSGYVSSVRRQRLGKEHRGDREGNSSALFQGGYEDVCTVSVSEVSEGSRTSSTVRRDSNSSL